MRLQFLLFFLGCLEAIKFEVDPFRKCGARMSIASVQPLLLGCVPRHCLLNGLDDIGQGPPRAGVRGRRIRLCPNARLDAPKE